MSPRDPESRACRAAGEHAAAGKRRAAPEPLLDERARRALETACNALGLDGSGARLMRLHANTVVHLPREDTVARLASTQAADGIDVSLAVTEDLARRGFPTVRPRARTVVCAHGLAVSFWVYAETVAASAAPGQLAAMLRSLHCAHPGPWQLPAMPSPLRGVAAALQSHPEALDAADRTWLAARVARCEQLWNELEFELPSGLVHGDPHPNNLLHTARGPLLGDWDHVARGPREWDLVQELYFHRRFPAPRDDLDAAALAYGWDLRQWPGVEDLVGIREVSGLGAYIRTAALKPPARAELAHRIETLRRGQKAARWRSPSTF